MPSSGCKTCALRSEEHTSELQSHDNLVCRLLLENKTIRSEEHTSELQSHDNLVCRILLDKKTQHTANGSVFYSFKRQALKNFRVGFTTSYIGERVAGRSTRFFFNNAATTEISLLSQLDALPI